MIKEVKGPAQAIGPVSDKDGLKSRLHTQSMSLTFLYTVSPVSLGSLISSHMCPAKVTLLPISSVRLQLSSW